MVALGGSFLKTEFWRKPADENKKHEQFPSMQIDKSRRLQNNVSFNNSKIVSYEKNA